jgi:DNA-binding winged helix-turn-helix (wHTH) protein
MVPVKQEASSSCLHFGLFEANLQTAELRKQGLKVKLGRQAFRLLTMLLRRPGQLRTREEIRDELWGKEVFVNFDQSLNKAVHQLRDALGDNAGNPHYIETVPERGYRFIYFAQTADRPARKQVLHSGHIAVLPFVTEPPNQEMELLNKILIETLIDRISLTPGLHVLAYRTVQCCVQQQFDPRAIGQTLLVPVVVIGDITQSGDQLLLHVELINVKDGTQRRGVQFKQVYSNVRSDPAMLAGRIYDELQPALLETSNKSPRRRLQSLETHRKPAEADDL